MTSNSPDLKLSFKVHLTIHEVKVDTIQTDIKPLFYVFRVQGSERGARREGRDGGRRSKGRRSGRGEEEMVGEENGRMGMPFIMYLHNPNLSCH